MQLKELEPSAVSAGPVEPVDIFLTHLPANLRAKFGRAQCRRLLADQGEVQRVWSRLQPVATFNGFHGDQAMQLRRGSSRLPPLKHRSQPAMDWYSVLSEQFNSDYSGGVTRPRRFGHTQETHDQAILERSPEFNSGDNMSANKHRRDEFAAYNEVIHVERKFNNFWAERDRQDQRAAPRQQEVRKPAVAAQQPQSAAPVSILASGGKSATSTAAAKRVTISSGNEAMNRSGSGSGGQNESLHRANTRTSQQA